MGVFKKNWLETGRAKRFIRENEIRTEDVNRMIETFKSSPMYSLIMLAFEDFNDYITSEFVTVSPSEAGYDRVMAQLQAERRYHGWFVALVEDLKSLENAAKAGARGKPKYA